MTDGKTQSNRRVAMPRWRARAAILSVCAALLACAGSGEVSMGSHAAAAGTTGTQAGSAGQAGNGIAGSDSSGAGSASTGGRASSAGTGGSLTAAAGVGGATAAGNGGSESRIGGAGSSAGDSAGGATGGAGSAGAGGSGAAHPTDAVAFNAHFYRFTKASIAGARAEALCEGLGGYLACIETESENAFLLTLAGTARPWFGLNNLANVKDWVWINGSPVTYKHWQPGQPDNPANEHWGKLLEDGSWDDGSVETSYLCEWDR